MADRIYQYIAEALGKSSYTVTKQRVYQYVFSFLSENPGFSLVTEKAFDAHENRDVDLIVMYGAVNAFVDDVIRGFPIKIVLNLNFPFVAPTVILNDVPEAELIKESNALVNNNQLTCNFLSKWSYDISNQQQQPTLSQMIVSLQEAIVIDPPLKFPEAPKVNEKELMEDILGEEVGEEFPEEFGMLNRLSMRKQTSVLESGEQREEKKKMVKQVIEKLPQYREQYVAIMHSEVKPIEEKYNEFAHRQMTMEEKISRISLTNNQLEKSVGRLTRQAELINSVLANKGGLEITEDYIKSEVCPFSNVFTERLISLRTKERALEDTIQTLKKGFEGGAISFEDFLMGVRQLSMKQFMAIAKKNKVVNYIKQNPQFAQ